MLVCWFQGSDPIMVLPPSLPFGKDRHFLVRCWVCSVNPGSCGCRWDEHRSQLQGCSPVSQELSHAVHGCGLWHSSLPELSLMTQLVPGELTPPSCGIWTPLAACSLPACLLQSWLPESGSFCILSAAGTCQFSLFMWFNKTARPS